MTGNERRAREGRLLLDLLEKVSRNGDDQDNLVDFLTNVLHSDAEVSLHSAYLVAQDHYEAEK